MKATTFLAILLLFLYQTAIGDGVKSFTGPETEPVRELHGRDSTGNGDKFQNAGFEDWTDGNPDFWEEVLDEVGNIINNVRTAPELFLKTEGDLSIRVQSLQPVGGISHSVSGETPEWWNVYPEKASAALHYAKANGTSAWFDEHLLVQDDFHLACSSGVSSAIRNAHALRLDNGDLIELFSACSTSEYSYQGAVYMKRNGGEPELFIDFKDHRTWTWPGVMKMDTNYIFVSMRIGHDGQQHLHATDITHDFTGISNDRLLFEIDSTNVQCYSMIKLSDGKIVLPIVYAAVGKVGTGPWFLDILTTYDLITVARLNKPKTYIGRGLMEAYPVVLSDETVAILCRTDQGHLAKAIYDPNAKTLSNAVATQIIQPKAGSYARNLSDNSILLSWLANVDLRKVLVMAVSDDDMVTWQSYHIIMTSAALGHPLSSQPPYIHQPFVFEDADGSLTCYFEEVLSGYDINLFKTTASEYRINNVANETKAWQVIRVEKPGAAVSLQLLNVIGAEGIAFYDQPIITEAPMAGRTGVVLFPNPVEDILTIASDKPVTHVDILNVNGRLLESFTGSNTIPMNQYSKGVYFIKVYRGLKVGVFKIVKI